MPYDPRTNSFEMDWKMPGLYRPGDLYVGGVHGREFGARLTKHAMIIGGSQTGKGAAFLIPNALRWPENLLVIDPKGENVEAVWRRRVAMGKRVRVIDPLQIANIPPELRCTYNPLDELNEAMESRALDIWERVMVLVDGLVKIHDPKHGYWDGGAKTILAGLIMLALYQLDPSQWTLPGMRARLLDACKDAKKATKELRDIPGPLGRAAAETLARKGEEAKSFLSAAMESTKWLDSPGIQGVLQSSDFRMKELKEGDTDVFLVLPPEYLEVHAGFLKLFVRGALDAMAKRVKVVGDWKDGGEWDTQRASGLSGNLCLFLLDEFHVLGYLKEVEEAAGLMAGYGVRMVIFAQCLAQISKIYGSDGAQIFVNNCDALVFFGLMDGDQRASSEYAAGWIGPITHRDIGLPYPTMEWPHWYPLPPDPAKIPRLEHPSSSWYREHVASRSNTPPQMLQSKNNRIGPEILNALLRADHSGAVAQSNKARMEIERLERERQTRHQWAIAGQQDEDRMRRVEYERQKVAYEEEIRRRRHAYDHQRNVLAHATGMVGKPRLTASEVRELTARVGNDKLARSAIVFTPEGPRLTKPRGFFEERQRETAMGN